MLTLVTGTPGAGKTLWTVEEIKKARAVGRRVFVQGVSGLDDSLGCEPVDVRHWQDPNVVPDGSLVVVDEAHSDDRFPQRTAGKTVPEYIAGLRVHRHRGLDFIIVTQAPKDVDVALRRLIGRHLYLENLFGTNSAQIFEWNKCNERPDDRGARFGAVKRTWPYPKETFGLYKSASLHTVQKRIPWKIWAIPVLLVAVVVLAWFAHRTLGGLTSHVDAVEMKPVASQSKSASAADLAQPMVTTRRSEKAIGPQEYVQQFVPRIASMPWSSPAFDDRKPVSKPELYCMSREDGPCSCITEQGTHYKLKQFECRMIARYGVYNPFRDPPEDREHWESGEFHDHEKVAHPPADPTHPESVAGDALKGGDSSTKDTLVQWPHPDLSYRVPFPSVRR